MKINSVKRTLNMVLMKLLCFPISSSQPTSSQHSPILSTVPGYREKLLGPTFLLAAYFVRHQSRQFWCLNFAWSWLPMRYDKFLAGRAPQWPHVGGWASPSLLDWLVYTYNLSPKLSIVAHCWILGLIQCHLLSCPGTLGLELQAQGLQSSTQLGVIYAP